MQPAHTWSRSSSAKAEQQTEEQRSDAGDAAHAAPADADASHVPVPSRADVYAWLRRCNPFKYGAREECSREQQASLEDAADGVLQLMAAVARRSPGGQLAASECPLLYTAEDPRNVWALEGRFSSEERTVELPLAGVRATIAQRWRAEPMLRGSGGAEDADLEGHSTAAVCWDASVVLADLVAHHPSVLLAFSANHARSRSCSRAEWRWSEKVVVELGCGVSALPACAAALNGPRAVVCTDGNARGLAIAAANVRRWRQDHPAATAPTVAHLRWGEGAEQGVLAGMGLEAPVDVVLAADCIYVLENPGGWGKLLATIDALSGPRTLVLLTYTDRGHDKMWKRFLAQRVEQRFHVIEVPRHLLHPCCTPGAKGRLEQCDGVGPVQVYCLARKEGASTA